MYPAVALIGRYFHVYGGFRANYSIKIYIVEAGTTLYINVLLGLVQGAGERKLVVKKDKEETHSQPISVE
jgi:hypothetical protein